ncbi:MAG: hypothetical protein N4A45_02845 [Flavobacteriales bacterium]|jgi:hypothetical protein|nr:hypothetical protein [Flavobacteriales bacterium]
MKRLFENELDLLIDIDGLCVCWEKPNKIENRSQLRIASLEKMQIKKQ